MNMRKTALVIATALLSLSGVADDGWLPAVDPRSTVGRLSAFESLAACAMPADAQRQMLAASRRQAAAARGGAMAPVRDIRDAYPSFAAVAVDTVRNEVVLTDENLFQVLVYDRTENTPPGAEASKPKRVISGEDTNIEFQSGVYVDQQTGEIFAANNDTRDTLVVFKHGSAGNVKPIRQVETPHGTFGVVVDEVHGELFMTEQHDSALVVYRKDATQEESPIRFMQGLKTGLQDPHGIALDPKEDVLFVANYGSTHAVAHTDKPKTGVNQADNREGKDNWPLGREFAVPGSGTINPPSITVYRRTARGRCCAAPQDSGAGYRPELADRSCVRSAGPRAVRGERCRARGARVRRSGERQREAEAQAEGREHEARQPHRRRRGPQEPGAVGLELRRAFRNGLRHLGVRERRAEADHPQCP